MKSLVVPNWKNNRAQASKENVLQVCAFNRAEVFWRENLSFSRMIEKLKMSGN